MSQYGDWRVSMFGRDGVQLEQLDCAFGYAAAMNKIGSGSLTLSRFDPKCRESLLKVSHFVVFEHERLADWGGVLSFEGVEDWNGKGELTLKPFASEYQFSRRRGPLYNKTDIMLDLRAPIGEAFKRVIGFANMEEDTRIREGKIYNGSRETLVKLRDAMCDKVVADIVKKSGFDYWLEPGRDANNRLVFYANLLERRGTNNGYALQEGVNLETPSGSFYRRDGKLINDVALRNNGAEDGGLIRKVATNDASRGEFGLWQAAQTINTDAELYLANYAEQIVLENSQPRQVFMLTAIESPQSPDTFSHIRLGDVVHVSLYSVGFWYGTNGADADVRIMSVEYSTRENKAMLTVETV